MTGLAEREAARRLVQYGANELQRRGGPTWLTDIVRQLVHPLALLLCVAAGLAWLVGTPSLGLAILAVIALKAGLAFVQERQAERAVEALREYMPQQATVVRQQNAPGPLPVTSYRATFSSSKRATESRRTRGSSTGRSR
jgi:magnesium-transporting ATPase (P-type)